MPTEVEKLGLDVYTALRESVSIGMKKANLQNTSENRLEVLEGMHSKLLGDGVSDIPPLDRMLLNVIEDEMLWWVESDEVCPRCGGDHSWCQNVQPGEY